MAWTEAMRRVFLRDIRAVQSEVRAYPNDEALWTVHPAAAIEKHHDRGGAHEILRDVDVEQLALPFAIG